MCILSDTVTIIHITCGYPTQLVVWNTFDFNEKALLLKLGHYNLSDPWIVLFNLFQIVIVGLGSTYYWTKRVLLVPDRSEKFTEYFCEFDYGFLASSIYNAILVLFCCYYAFRSRQVPDNYNESKFIGISVYSNVVVCLSVIPVYTVANSALYKIAIVCLALLVNSYLHLLCVYAPKIYAVRFKTEDETVRTLHSRPDQRTLSRTIKKSVSEFTTDTTSQGREENNNTLNGSSSWL